MFGGICALDPVPRRPLLGLVALAAQSGPPRITNQDILAGLKDGTKWLTYSGNYFGHRS